MVDPVSTVPVTGSANERLARAAEVTLEKGPMSWTQRRDDHVRWLDATFGDGLNLLRGIANTHPASTCAVCVGMWAMLGGVQKQRVRPAVPAITTWAGFGGFGGRFWIPVNRLRVRRGDVLYWCGGSDKTWPAATNGHVGVALTGDGWHWTTAEGGGGADGTLCRMSQPKDIRLSGSRPLRGVWRADGISSDTDPAPPPTLIPSERRTLRRGDAGPDVRAMQPKVGAKADGDFGPKTEAAVMAFQSRAGLKADGIVGPKTWAALEALG